MRKRIDCPLKPLRLQNINLMLKLETNDFPALYRMLVIPIYEDLNEM